MTAIDHDELNEAMRLLATTESAVLALVDAYADRLRAVVRDHLRRLDRPDPMTDVAEVDGLLSELAATDDDLAPLAQLPWVTGGRVRRQGASNEREAAP